MATFLRTRTTITLNAGASTALLTYYWDSTGAVQTALVTEAMARVRAFWQSLQGNVVSNAAISFNPVADEVEETTGQIVGQVVGTLPAALSFTGTGDYLPLQTQAVMRLTTGTFIRGRRLQGRQFLPGISETLNSAGGNPSPAFVTAINTAGALLGTTVVTPMNQRVWSRPGPGFTGLTSIVTGRVGSASWGVLRSRRA